MDVSDLRLCRAHQASLPSDPQIPDRCARRYLLCRHLNRRVSQWKLAQKTRLLSVGLQRCQAQLSRCHPSRLCPTVDGGRSLIRENPAVQTHSMQKRIKEPRTIAALFLVHRFMHRNALRKNTGPNIIMPVLICKHTVRVKTVFRYDNNNRP